MDDQRKGHEKGERTGTCAMNNDHDYHHHCSATEGEGRRQGRGVFIYWS